MNEIKSSSREFPHHDLQRNFGSKQSMPNSRIARTPLAQFEVGTHLRCVRLSASSLSSLGRLGEPSLPALPRSSQWLTAPASPLNC